MLTARFSLLPLAQPLGSLDLPKQGGLLLLALLNGAHTFRFCLALSNTLRGGCAVFAQPPRGRLGRRLERRVVRARGQGRAGRVRRRGRFVPLVFGELSQPVQLGFPIRLLSLHASLTLLTLTLLPPLGLPRVRLAPPALDGFTPLELLAFRLLHLLHLLQYLLRLAPSSRLRLRHRRPALTRFNLLTPRSRTGSLHDIRGTSALLGDARAVHLLPPLPLLRLPHPMILFLLQPHHESLATFFLLGERRSGGRLGRVGLCLLLTLLAFLALLLQQSLALLQLCAARLLLIPAHAQRLSINRSRRLLSLSSPSALGCYVPHAFVNLLIGAVLRGNAFALVGFGLHHRRLLPSTLQLVKGCNTSLANSPCAFGIGAINKPFLRSSLECLGSRLLVE